MTDLRTSAWLLSMILLTSGPEPCKVKYCSAVFANHQDYDTALVKAGRKSISIKYVDSEDQLRDNGSIYDELVRVLYKILENGGHVSDGKKRLNAAMVPDFMINCVMNGCS